MPSPYKQTISLCPVCYKRIPAAIVIEPSGVFITKACFQHGHFKSMVERNVEFYLNCMKSSAKTIYAGYFIDVTEKCNLQCAHCYYPVDNRAQDPSIDEICQNALMHKHLAPFILTGGEPTLRRDLDDLIFSLKCIGPVELLTNGTGLTEKSFEGLVPMLSDGAGNAAVNLSIHPEVMEDNLRVIELFREHKATIESILWVIDSVEQVGQVVEFCERHRDVIKSARIKAATRVWDDQKSENKFFVSDMLREIERIGARVVWWRDNKVSFVTTELNGIYYMLVSWYDVNNVDVLDIGCAPYYQAKTGETLNILTSMLINEGMAKGFLNGRGI